MDWGEGGGGGGNKGNFYVSGLTVHCQGFILEKEKFGVESREVRIPVFYLGCPV